MRITAHELLAFGIIDDVIAEPEPAHENPRAAIQAAGREITRQLSALIEEFPLHDEAALDRLVAARYERFRAIGSWQEDPAF